MKRTRVIVAALLVTLGPSIHAQPKLEFVGGPKLDLGSMYRGALVERHITVKNDGSETLMISRVDVSCGCTGTMISNDRIAPGDTGTLQITFNSKNFRGPIHKTVTVTSNDPDHPQTIVEFKGTVVEEVVVSPEYLWFQDAVVGAKNTRMLTVKNDGKVGLQLKSFSSPLQGIKIILPAGPVQPGSTVELPVEFTPSEANPVLTEQLTITTSNPQQAEITVALYGNARSGKANN